MAETIPETIPDYCEPLLAWRSWSVTSINPVSPDTNDQRMTVPHLMSSYASHWFPYERLEAKHQDRTGVWLTSMVPLPDVPCSGCPCDDWQPDTSFGCGIYGYKQSESLMRYLKGQLVFKPILVGQVALWGRIVEHKHGYRAQYAYPKRLVYGGETAIRRTRVQQLAESYGIPYEEDLSWTSVFQSDASLANRSPILSPSAPHLYFLPNQYGQFLRTPKRGHQNLSPHPLWFPPDEKDVTKDKG